MENETQNQETPNIPALIYGPPVVLAPASLGEFQKIAIHQCSNRTCGNHVGVPVLELPATVFVRVPPEKMRDERVRSAVQALNIPIAILVYDSLNGRTHTCPLCGSALSSVATRIVTTPMSKKDKAKKAEKEDKEEKTEEKAE